MTRASEQDRGSPPTIEGVVDAVFGRWPWWPWSVLGFVVVGGLVGAAAAAWLQRAFPAAAPALGTAACAGYGSVVAALLSILPRAFKLLALRSALSRRPAQVEASWWPLALLAAALRPTPVLRLTQQEFAAAVGTAVGQARTLLGHRFWPAYATALVAPVLGLITAWTNGARVMMRMQDAAAAQVYPALVAAVSPPMVATIGASLALMVTIVVLDQLTKGLLVRWSGVVEPGDAGHASIREMLQNADSGATVRDESAGDNLSGPRDPELERVRRYHRDPDELERKWRESAPRSE